MRGDRVKAAREFRGLSQGDLAARTGLHAQQIYKIEVGKSDNPTAETVIAIARALEVSSDYLLGLVEDTKGAIQENDLSPMERRLISAVRNGQIVEAVKAAADLSDSVQQPAIATK